MALQTEPAAPRTPVLPWSLSVGCDFATTRELAMRRIAGVRGRDARVRHGAPRQRSALRDFDLLGAGNAVYHAVASKPQGAAYSRSFGDLKRGLALDALCVSP